jgi:hypothetical protein
VLVTCEVILEHAEADQRVLEAAERYSVWHAAGHGRLVRALRLCGDDSTSVGDAVRRAAADLAVEADGRSFQEVAVRVVAGEAPGGAAARPERAVSVV